MELAQGTPEGLDFVFVGIFLALGYFERLKHLLHLVEHLAQSLDGLIDLFDGPLDGRRQGRLRLAGSGRRAIGSGLGGSRPERGLRRLFRLGGEGALRLRGTRGLRGGFGSTRGLRLSGRLGPFERLKFLDLLRLEHRLRGLRSGGSVYFLSFIRDGGFGRVPPFRGGVLKRRGLRSSRRSLRGAEEFRLDGPKLVLRGWLGLGPG
jgi:hypothetical protein